MSDIDSDNVTCVTGQIKGIEEGRDPKTGRWIKGFSGGGQGLKKGKRHGAAVLAQSMIDGDAEEIVRGVIQRAKEGDPVSVRLVVERIVPVRKNAPVKIDLPTVETAEDAGRAIQIILAQQADGELTSDEADGLLKTVDMFIKTVAVADLAEQVAQLKADRGIR